MSSSETKIKDSYYFPHDYHARNDTKMEEMFLKYGCEGRGIFWTFIEMLYENNGFLPYDKIDFYANALRTECERIASILNDFELFKNDGKFFWSESCLRRLEKLKEKREKARQSSFKRWKKDAKAIGSECERNARKESKVKESKVNKESNTARMRQLPDEDFIKSLKTSLAYKEIDIDRELAKMDAWLTTRPGRRKTKRFIINWLNRIDIPLKTSSPNQLKRPL